MSRLRCGRGRYVFLAGIMTLAACASPNETQRFPLILHATSAAYPWLEAAYDCTPSDGAIVLSDDPHADIVIRLGEPVQLARPAFQIGTEELIVVTHPRAGIGLLTANEVAALFAGQIRNWSEVDGPDLPVVVWAYDSTADLQLEFNRAVLHGRPISSRARLAVSAQHMSDSVGGVLGSIGILSRRWKAGNTHEVLMFATVPVLAITREEPSGGLARLIGCMQTTP